jgi:hypothetical protein
VVLTTAAQDQVRALFKVNRWVVCRLRAAEEACDEESKTTVISFIIADCQQPGIRAATSESAHQSGLFGARRKQYANAVDLDSIPQVEVLGITVVSGNQWRDEEVAHTLRLLELIGGTDIPVVPGAVFPLVDRRKEALLWQAMYGKVAFAGAWDDRWWHEHDVIPTLPEGQPHYPAGR